ncbi:MAG: Fic family protein [Planctomycetota bacterium]
MTYIHELQGWPEFTWDIQALTAMMTEVRHKQGRHLGKMEAMRFDLQEEANLISLTDEIVKSSAIEGENLNTGEVRSSIARRLGLDIAGLPEPGREVEGVVEMMLDATRNFDTPLTSQRLFDWHAALFPTGRSGIHKINVGKWRDDRTGPMRVISGPMGKEKVHFQAPAAHFLAEEMDRFLTWFKSNDSIDSILRAGVAHFWFITIHPFDDGNGRIARAIADMALSKADGTKERFYSMSAGIESKRKEYYIQLESSQRGSLDITSWLAWFLNCLDQSIDNAADMLSGVIHKTKLWQQINTKPVNDRQRMVINRMLEPDWEGHLNTSKYAKLTKCSSDTALRDIQELLKRGALIKNIGGGRSTSYRLADPDDIF